MSNSKDSTPSESTQPPTDHPAAILIDAPVGTVEPVPGDGTDAAAGTAGSKAEPASLTPPPAEKHDTPPPVTPPPSEEHDDGVHRHGTTPQPEPPSAHISVKLEQLPEPGRWKLWVTLLAAVIPSIAAPAAVHLFNRGQLSLEERRFEHQRRMEEEDLRLSLCKFYITEQNATFESREKALDLLAQSGQDCLLRPDLASRTTPHQPVDIWVRTQLSASEGHGRIAELQPSPMNPDAAAHGDAASPSDTATHSDTASSPDKSGVPVTPAKTCFDSRSCRSGCDNGKGSIDDCNNLGIMLARGFVYSTNSVWAEVLSGADLETTIEPEVLRKKVREALSVFEAACERGHAAACNNAGVLMPEVKCKEACNDAHPSSYEWTRLLEKSCALGYKLGCVNRELNRADEVDEFRGLVILCTAGVPEACQHLLYYAAARDYCGPHEEENPVCTLIGGESLAISEGFLGDFQNDGLLISNRG
jgi:hypothetical protein